MNLQKTQRLAGQAGEALAREVAATSAKGGRPATSTASAAPPQPPRSVVGSATSFRASNVRR